MAAQAFKKAFLSINGVDLSQQIRSATLNYSAEPLDKTSIFDDTRSRIGGLKDWSFDLEFYGSYDAGLTDATLFPLVGSSTFTVLFRPSTTAASSTNPQYQGTGYLENYNPVQGAVGELIMTPVRVLAASDLLRITT